MKKSEFIEKRGIEAWEHHLAISREWVKRNKERHCQATMKCRKKNAEKYKAVQHKWNINNSGKHLKSSKKTFRAFCKNDEYELIENYDLAKADNFKGWHCHHRLELHPDNTLRFTQESLERLDLYLNRPARELIFLRNSEHARMHSIARWSKQ